MTARGERPLGRGVVAQTRNGKVRILPWTESVTGRDGSLRDFEETVQVDWGVRKQPKRTPADRLEATFLRYHNEAVERQKQTGVYELPREMFNEMQLMLWKEGQPLTQEALRQMVARGLERAEAKMRADGRRRFQTEDYHHQGVIEVRTR